VGLLLKPHGKNAVVAFLKSCAQSSIEQQQWRWLMGVGPFGVSTNRRYCCCLPEDIYWLQYHLKPIITKTFLQIATFIKKALSQT
jgi:hypothetical protein